MAILAAEIFTEVLLQTRPRTEVWEWLIQLAATGLAAIFAIGVFEYQSRQAERDRQNKLLAALAAELRSNLDSIRSERCTPFVARVQPPGVPSVRYVKYAEAKLVPMLSVAAEAAIQSGVFDANDVYLLTRIVRELQVHNSEVSYLSSIRSSPEPVHGDAIVFATKESDRRQRRIEKWSQELVEFLRTQERIEVRLPPETEGDTGG